jgi:hypothetical protein
MATIFTVYPMIANSEDSSIDSVFDLNSSVPATIATASGGATLTEFKALDASMGDAGFIVIKVGGVKQAIPLLVNA